MFILSCFLYVIVYVSGDIRGSENNAFSPAPSSVLLDKYFWRNATMSPPTTKMTEAPTAMYKFPTATWSASAYEERRKMYKPETSKLYLFKPSPFLKPPFTGGGIGVPISGIEDGVDVMGRRTGKLSRESSDRRIALDMDSKDQEAMEDSSHDEMQLDFFLEQSLGKYLESSNLNKIFGPISVETFSEALRRVIQEKKAKMLPYDRNKELRRKFRDEVLFPKKSDQKPMNGLLEKQYQRRLQKTWEILNDTSTSPSVSNIEEHMSEWFPTEATSEMTSTFEPEYSDYYTTMSPSTTELLPLATTPAPRRKGRGSTKYRDTVKNSIDSDLADEGEIQLSVAETVYYRPREQSLNTFTYKEESFGSIPGEPGRDYPMLSTPPRSGFKCPRVPSSEHKMVADRSTRCQVFYICKGDSPPSPMLCPNGTMFNEDVLVCDWWYNVDC